MEIDSSTVQWTPLADYKNAHHVLGAGVACVAPGTGNIYWWDCVQWSGARQDLNIYRLVAKTNAWEHVVRFEGMVNAEKGFERGQCQIGQGGALLIATTMIPKGVPYVTETGFQGVRCRIPNVDEPWSLSNLADPALAARIAALEHLAAQQASAIVAIETALGNLTAGDGLSDGDRQALGWVKQLIDYLYPV
jgi:hypothetical protein